MNSSEFHLKPERALAESVRIREEAEGGSALSSRAGASSISDTTSPNLPFLIPGFPASFPLMPRTGKCPNYADCLMAYRGDLITVAGDEPYTCPECKQPLVDAGRASSRQPMIIQFIILGGISMLVLTGAGAVYYQVRKVHEKPPAGQIGTSFEQAEIAGEQGQFLPSRHMTAVTPAPAPSATPTAAATPAGP